MRCTCSAPARVSPTIVLDAGLGGWSLDWVEVQPSVAHSTRVWSYDRPGMGWSSTRPKPRDAQHAVDELHALLMTGGSDGYSAGVNRASFGSTIAAEAQLRQTSTDQVRQMGTLGDLPMVVLASSRPVAFHDDPVPPELSGRISDMMHVMLKSSHQAIAHLSATGHVESAAETGFYIQFDRADAVIQAIHDMLVASR